MAVNQKLSRALGWLIGLRAVAGEGYGCAMTINVLARSSAVCKQRRNVAGSSAPKLVQNDQIRALQQRASHKHSAPLAVRKLPSGFADHLQQAGGHAIQQVAQAERAANFFGFSEIFFSRRPAAPHQQIESERAGQHVVFVKLRR